MNLLSPEGRNQFLNDYFNSAEFGTLSGQATNQQLAASEATGGLGSTSTQNQLGRIAPNLGLGALAGQMGQYGNLVNTGLNASGMASGSMQNAGNNLSDLALQRGAYQAGGIGANQSNNRQLFGTLGQIGGGIIGGIFGGPAGAAGGSAVGGAVGNYAGGLF